MQSTFNILVALIAILKEGQNEIPEDYIFIGEPSKQERNEFISINTINNPNKYLQVGYGNINIHANNIADRANTTRFRELVNIIIPLIDDTRKDNYYFQIEDDKGIFTDADRDGMSYYNIKIKFQTL